MWCRQSFILISVIAMTILGCSIEIECPKDTKSVVERRFFKKKRAYCIDQLGRKQGKMIIWKEDGSTYEEYYLDGENDGRWQARWPNGNPKGEGRWDKESLKRMKFEKEGRWRNWHPNGQLEQEIVYKDDRIISSRPKVDGHSEGDMCWDAAGKVVQCPLTKRSETWQGQKRFSIKGGIVDNEN
jgi:antitoxin component YwqK of YwqJK toxin-antitoxin module